MNKNIKLSKKEMIKKMLKVAKLTLVMTSKHRFTTSNLKTEKYHRIILMHPIQTNSKITTIINRCIMLVKAMNQEKKFQLVNSQLKYKINTNQVY